MNGSALLHWLFPNRCACCGRVIYADRRLCDACRDALPYIPDGECPACGLPRSQCVCGNAKRTFFPCVSPFYYEGVVRDGLVTLKTENATHGVPFFADCMAQKATAAFGGQFDGVVFVPMTKAATRARGYNQSRLLAKALAKRLRIPLLDGALRRLMDTESQHLSGMLQRKGNVFGVFEADPALVAGKHLLLVDDIITTGATLDECGKMLMLADCEEVVGVTVASTKRGRTRAEEEEQEEEQL